MRRCPELFPIRAEPGLLLLPALLLLTVPLPWLAAVLLAGAVHELAHLLAIRITGGICTGIRFDPGGAVIAADGLSFRQAILCALAGPAGGLLLLPLFPWLPRTALCAAAQSVLNLLPLPGTDGGTVIDLLCRRFLPPKDGRRLLHGLFFVTAVVLFLLSLIAAWQAKLWFPPAILAFSLVSRLRIGKKPCKYTSLRVQ